MPTTIVRLWGFDGPNIYSSQPGVLLQVQADKDRSMLLRDLLKDGAQRVGMVLAYLDVSAVPANAGYAITARFTTPTPAIGVELARLAVAALLAREAGDESWDFDEQLWDLQKRRRAEALPIQALQIVAAATRRGLPSFVRADGRLQLGSGARGWLLDLATLPRSSSAALLAPDAVGSGSPFAAPADLPWAQIGTVPLIALSGGAAADAVARAVATLLRTQGHAVGLAEHASFDEVRALLADPTLEHAVISVDADDLLRRGLPFAQCDISVLVDLPEPLLPDAADRAEWARALGLPLLVTVPHGAALINDAVPELTALAAYAPCRVVPFGAGADVAALAAAALDKLTRWP